MMFSFELIELKYQAPFGSLSSETATRIREVLAGSPKAVSVCSSETTTKRPEYWS